MHVNHLGQPIGESVGGWTAPRAPSRAPIEGRYCRLEPLEAHHARELWDAYAHDLEHRNWTYLMHGPYARFDDFAAWIDRARGTSDPLFFAIRTSSAVGVAAYLRITPEDRSKWDTSTIRRSFNGHARRPKQCI